MKRFALVPILVLGVAVYACLDPDSGVRTWLALRGDLAAAEQRIAEQEREISVMRAEARALDADPLALERAIREELGWARPGETVVHVPPAFATNTRIP